MGGLQDRQRGEAAGKLDREEKIGGREGEEAERGEERRGGQGASGKNIARWGLAD